MDADEARRRSTANAKRNENRARTLRLKKAAKEREESEREAKKLLSRAEKEIAAAVKKGYSSVRFGWVGDKLYGALSKLLSEKGYRCHVRDGGSDWVDELEVNWGEDRGR